MVIHSEQLNGIAICAGNGGLELGLRLALGDQYKTVCYVEREAYNAATLVARMEDEVLDTAPIWDDCKTFDGKPWRGLVDVISAGFPCQPHSSAGKRKGMSDERWLWDDIERIVCEILPGIVWLENVPDLAFSGLDRVLGSLSEAGYSSVWDTFSAEETGASQKRERLFIFSYANRLFDGSEQTEWKTWGNFISGSYRQNFSDLADGDNSRPRQRFEGRCSTRESGEIVAQSVSQRWGKAGENGNLKSGEFNESSQPLAKPFSIASRSQRQKKNKKRSTNAVVGTGNFVFPPFRDDFEGWTEYLAIRPDLKPAVLRSTDGIPNRLDRLRTIGNGVVPLVVAYAFSTLARVAFNINE